MKAVKINLVKAKRSLFKRHFSADLNLELFCLFHSHCLRWRLQQSD